MKDEDPGAALVIGVSGKEVTAIFAQSPGALQLLPSIDYGLNWLQVTDKNGKVFCSFPKSDPYAQIYLQRDRWWSLINEEWLSPAKGKPISWTTFEENIEKAKSFHADLAGKYHMNTFVFYGTGIGQNSYEKISWIIEKGVLAGLSPNTPSVDSVPLLKHQHVRSDGSNHLHIGGNTVISTSTRGDASTAYVREESFWKIRCSKCNSSGDGTVPTISGRAPRISGGGRISQQFELGGVEHEPAFRDYPSAQTVAYYAITKLAARADRS